MKFSLNLDKYLRFAMSLILCSLSVSAISALDLYKPGPFGSQYDVLKQILNKKDDVPSLLMAINMICTDAKQNDIKKSAPLAAAEHFNLCKCAIYQNTDFCRVNKGIKRVEMPQLAGNPMDPRTNANVGKAAKSFRGGVLKDALGKEVNQGHLAYDMAKKWLDRTGRAIDKNKKLDKAVAKPLASELEVSKDGEVNLGDLFQKFLKEVKKYKITPAKLDAAQLRATQEELQGGKVASMWFSLKGEKTRGDIKSLWAPIFVAKAEESGVAGAISGIEDYKDVHYILDGHHRWAALYALEFGGVRAKKVEMNVNVIETSIDSLMDATSEFLALYGIETKEA